MPAKVASKARPSEASTVEDQDVAGAQPTLLVTLEGVPLDLVLTAMQGKLRLDLDEVAGRPLQRVEYRVDDGDWHVLDQRGRRWQAFFDTDDIVPGVHRLEVRAALGDGARSTAHGVFRVRGGGL